MRIDHQVAVFLEHSIKSLFGREQMTDENLNAMDGYINADYIEQHPFNIALLIIGKVYPSHECKELNDFLEKYEDTFTNGNSGEKVSDELADEFYKDINIIVDKAKKNNY